MSSIFDQPLDEREISFAKVDDGLSFAETFKKAWSAVPSFDETAASRIRDVPADLAQGAAAFGRVARAAYDQVSSTELTNSRRILAENSLDGVIGAVRGVSGVTLENPLRGGYWREAGGDEGMIQPDQVQRSRQLEVFEQKLQELRTSDPRIDEAVTAAQAEFAPERIAHRAEAELTAATAAAPNALGGFVATLAGGFPAMLRDPVNVAGLALGGGQSLAVSATGRVIGTMLREAGVNAALTAVTQPTVQSTRQELGLEGGLQQALGNVAMAAGFGAGFGGLLAGAREFLSGARALPPRERGVLEHAIGADVADAVAMADAPATLRGGSGGRKAVADAVAWVEDPYNQPPPELVLDLPAPRQDRARVTTEELPAKLGQTETVDGKPVRFGRFPADTLGTDAAAFQYKGGSDAAGVTDRLRSVTQWDPLASGKVMVFETVEGARVVADGHQRLGLAQRISAANPDAKVPLDGFLFREADGWTREDVRAIAAKKNLQENSGDAIDAARVLRDRPDLADGALPTTAPMMRQALALARLSDDAWGMAVNGAVPANYAAAVGAMVADPLQHGAVLALLAKTAPETERSARLLIGEAMEAGFTAEHQIDLFGAAEATRSLMVERVAVLDTALTNLRKDKRLFGTLSQAADTIEGAGNVLARDVNRERATGAAQLEDILTRIARRSGPVSDALNVLAARLANGEAKTKLAREFLDQVQATLDERGLIGLLVAPELKPARIVEPGTPEAVRMAEDASPTPTAPETGAARPGPPEAPETAIAAPAEAPPVEAPPPSLFDAVPLGIREDGGDARLMTREAALAEVDRGEFYGDLVAACRS